MSIKTISVSCLIAFCALLPTSVSAATVSDLQAQIQALLVQIAALQESATSDTASTQSGEKDSSSKKSKATCTIRTNRAVVQAGNPFVISWKTKNISDPTLIEDIKAGGEMSVRSKGSRTYKENYEYLAHFSIYSPSTGSAKNPLCTVEVNIVKNKNALVQFEPITYGTPNPTLLGSATKVSTFGISVDNGDKVYGSGPDAITVSSAGRWSHTITTALANGSYNVKAYDKSNNEIGSGTFRVATENTTPSVDTSGSTASDMFSASPLAGKKPLTVTFTGTVNAKKSCGGGSYTLSFGDGTSYDISVPADLCRVSSFTTTHVYAKDGTYTSALYRGKVADGSMIMRTFIRVSTPEMTTTSSGTTSGGSTTDTVPVSPNDVEENGSNGESTLLQSAAVYIGIQKQLIFLSEQLKLLVGN